MTAEADRVSLADQVRCVERELQLRERLYPDFVARRRMKPADAKRELARMRAVLVTLRRLAADEARQQSLFADLGGDHAVSSPRLRPRPQRDQADVRSVLEGGAAAPAAPPLAGDP